MINHSSIFSTTTKIEKADHFASVESLEDKKIEQNDIIPRNYEQSFEDEETFEDAANESAPDNESGDDDLGDFDSEMDSLDSEMDGDFGDDMDSVDDNGGDSNVSGVDDLEKNRGSSLNPFTQIYQKNYLIGELNELSNSIQHTISEYNNMYADWSELNQLRELKQMLDEERNSFIMQQNPENLIKLRLYMTQYETIVKKLSSLISDKAKRTSKTHQSDKSNSISKN